MSVSVSHLSMKDMTPRRVHKFANTCHIFIKVKYHNVNGYLPYLYYSNIKVEGNYDYANFFVFQIKITNLNHHFYTRYMHNLVAALKTFTIFHRNIDPQA